MMVVSTQVPYGFVYQRTERRELVEPKLLLDILKNSDAVLSVLNRWLLQRLSTDECCYVTIFPIYQWHEPVLCKLRFSPVADCNFRGALGVDTTVITWEYMHWQIFDNASGFHTANRSAPTVVLKRAVNVGGHCGPNWPNKSCCGWHRSVFKVEAIDRVFGGAVRQARKES